MGVDNMGSFYTATPGAVTTYTSTVTSTVVPPSYFTLMPYDMKFSSLSSSPEAKVKPVSFFKYLNKFEEVRKMENGSDNISDVIPGVDIYVCEYQNDSHIRFGVVAMPQDSTDSAVFDFCKNTFNTDKISMRKPKVRKHDSLNTFVVENGNHITYAEVEDKICSMASTRIAQVINELHQAVLDVATEDKNGLLTDILDLHKATLDLCLLGKAVQANTLHLMAASSKEDV